MIRKESQVCIFHIIIFCVLLLDLIVDLGGPSIVRGFLFVFIIIVSLINSIRLSKLGEHLSD